MHCTLIGAPVQSGTKQSGCVMGPDAFRCAGLADELKALGNSVDDRGNLAIAATKPLTHPNPEIHQLAETSAWTKALMLSAQNAAETGTVPVFLGGDHSISAGTIPGVAAHAEGLGQPQFVLWLDAHTDFHRLSTTKSGNLHGTPLAYITGQAGFEGYFPDLETTVAPENIMLLGIRSVDPEEREMISETGIEITDMRRIDEVGIKAPLEAFLTRVAKANGRLHVSFDVDFLDPQIACAVGTTVPGGATFREAHLVMELLHESGLVTSLDLVELNPYLDKRGRTARLMVDLCASLMGRKILDRPTRRY